ncbi:MAG: ATP synthase subunit I [Planctomycetes bacterium]|nr:ATP synthase subunit I [Planctomycetota bacterium]
MSEPWSQLLAWIAGMVLGVFFFGGLWWTIRRLVSAKRPALWVIGSFLLRTSAALFGFYFVSGRRLDRLLLCLLGFVMARILVTRLTRFSHERDSSNTRGQTCT